MPEDFTGSDFSAAIAAATATTEVTSTSDTSSPSATANTATPQTASAAIANTAVSVTANTAAANTATVVSANTAVEPPQDRWPVILENARKKAREEAEAQYAWARGVHPDEAQNIRRFLEMGNQNPMLALDHIVQRILASNPQQSRAQVERYFTSIFQGQEAADPDPMPQPDIPTDQSNGKPVVYSAERMQELLQWQARKLKSEVDQELHPIRAERIEATQKQLSAAGAAKVVGAVQNLPGFAEHKAEIIQAYEAMPLNDDSGRTEGEKLRDAYLQVVGTKLMTQGRQQAVEDITRKASATTINPNATVSAAPFDYDKASIAEALEYEFNQRKGR